MTIKKALEAFVEAVEATGGGVRDEMGIVSPVADPEWTDLGDAYVAACEALGRKPKIAEADEELDENDNDYLRNAEE
jgi:hypothetical protein